MDKWDFAAPKFWDLSESIIQDRPNDSWFIEANVSLPSFPKKPQRRLKSKFDSKPILTKTPTIPTEENVYHRLSTMTTISFSHKMIPSQKRSIVEPGETIVTPLDNYDNKPRKRLKLRSNKTESSTKEKLYKEMENTAPVIVEEEKMALVTTEKRNKVVTEYFQNLLNDQKKKKENELEIKQKVHSFFKDIKSKSKTIHENIQNDKVIEMEEIAVYYPNPFVEQSKTTSIISYNRIIQ